jgi:hypothetical protein
LSIKCCLSCIRNAVRQPVVYTEEAPKITPEVLAEFRKVNAEGRERVMCTLRVQRSTLDWWKSLGDGYTVAMARLLDEARNYPELIKIICKVCFFVIASTNCYSILLQYKELVKRSNCATLNLTMAERLRHVKI